MTTRRVRVYGRVQGVGFRAFVWREAAALGVDGWVRNRTDGTVEAVIAADDPILDRLVDRIRQGPRWSRVDRIEETAETSPPSAAGGFEIRSDR
jgi:acylphosphatase